MLKISLSPRHKQLLLNLEAAGYQPEEVVLQAMEGTLSYYEVHGTLTFLTPDTRDCFGCRLLQNAKFADTYLSKAEGQKAKIIPFEPPEPQANGTA